MEPIAETMSDLSSLTRVQVETLRIQQMVSKNQISIDMALTKRKNKVISRGTHYRILRQAKKNVRESLFTVVIAVQMGLARVEDVQKLISAAYAIPVDVDTDRASEIVGLVKILVERVVE